MHRDIFSCLTQINQRKQHAVLKTILTANVFDRCMLTFFPLLCVDFFLVDLSLTTDYWFSINHRKNKAAVSQLTGTTFMNIEEDTESCLVQPPYTYIRTCMQNIDLRNFFAII